MTSDDSDDEPLSVLAASKKTEDWECNNKTDVDDDLDYTPQPKKKKTKKVKKTKRIVVNEEELSIRFGDKLNKLSQPVIQRPEDVWLYMKDFNPVGPYSCLLCPEWFISKAKIALHYILNHQKAYCGICRYFVADRDTWENHMSFHIPWPCSQCEESFPTDLELRKHFSSVHNLVHCLLCHFRVADNEQYQEHLLRKHNVTKVPRHDDEILWILESDGSPRFICILCSKANIPTSTFFNHFMGHHHSTLKCVASILGGKETPFSLEGANISQKFVESLQTQGKCGYVDLDKKTNIESEYDVKKNEDAMNILAGIKEEVLSDNDEPKKEVLIREDFDIIKTYKGDEDFDVTLVEMIVFQQNYYEYVNKIFDQIDSSNLIVNAQIDYESEKLNQNLVEIGCSFCSTKSHTLADFSIHMNKMHGVKIVPSFWCRLCVTTFDSQSELDNHTTEELGDFEDLWICQFCEKEFDNRVSTRSHLSEHKDLLEVDNCFSPHLGFKCRYCPTLFWNEPDREHHHIKEHFEENKGNYYKCLHCDKIFSDKIWYTHHYIKAHQTDNPTTSYLFKCQVCAIILSTISQMRGHFEAEHPGSRKIFCSLDGCQYRPLSHKKSFQLHLRAMHRKALRKDQAVRCELCGREFPSPRSLNSHMAQSHGRGKYKCQLCKEVLQSMDERKLHYLLCHPGHHPFSCSECGKSFLYKSSLYMHKKDHSTVKQDFTCNICNKVFAKKDSYREHLLIHEGPRHACSYCPMRFVQRSNMLRHERRHTGERPYACPHCDRTFADKGACTSHARTHNKEASYGCLYCGQTFAQKSKLTYHIRRHTGENLESCPVCSKLFTSGCALREHMKIHDKAKAGVKCPVCDRSYQDERYMLRHVRNAHSAHRHTCPVCHKALSTVENLRAHVLTHSRKNMFWCKFCPKSYTVKKTMVRHLRRRHGLKGSEINVTDFYKKLDPRDCELDLDEETMTNLFGKSKKKVSDILIGDFITFPNSLNIPENKGDEDNSNSTDDEQDDEENNESEHEIETKFIPTEIPPEVEPEQELEPTDFVSVKIEPVDE